MSEISNNSNKSDVNLTEIFNEDDECLVENADDDKKLRFNEKSESFTDDFAGTEDNGEQMAFDTVDPLSCIKHFSTDEFAKRLVNEVIEESTARMAKIHKMTKTVFIEGIKILNQNSSVSTFVSILSSVRTLNWPRIGEFSIELATDTVEEYISMWKLKEGWKYFVKLIKTESDEISDIYTFDAMFSIPTEMYPIPQATASVYFTMEVSRVCPDECPVDVYYSLEMSRQKFYPGQFQFQEMWLNNIVDAKIKFYKTLRF